jgi:penicillin-binding protein 2
VAIGQGYLTITPLQLAVMTGGIAAGGVWQRPHLVKDPARIEPRKSGVGMESINQVIYGMYGVVNQGGTGGVARLPGVEVCGKTGTAQLASNELLKTSTRLAAELKDNAWFVAFAPRVNPEIVVSVLFEGGGHGDQAAPIARDVMKAYFDKKNRNVNRMPTLALAPHAAKGFAN